ncbi:hypothetical protein KAT60_00100 [Candidatus Woesebacteria bacterium]|nr:hypothetical protein [Candidatus Woesebacteria bacterium]
MSPIEIHIDGRFVGKSSSGPSEIKLPEPPGGEVEWKGDGSGFGQIITGASKRYEVFGFTELGQEAKYKVAKDLSASLFKDAASTTQITIKRV